MGGLMYILPVYQSQLKVWLGGWVLTCLVYPLHVLHALCMHPISIARNRAACKHVCMSVPTSKPLYAINIVVVFIHSIKHIYSAIYIYIYI